MSGGVRGYVARECLVGEWQYGRVYWVHDIGSCRSGVRVAHLTSWSSLHTSREAAISSL